MDFDKLWDFEHPDQTRHKFLSLLPQAHASGDEDYLGQLLTQIARTQGLAGRFDEAHATLDSVQQILNAANELNVVRIRYLLERGRVFNSSDQPAKAAPLFEQAASLAGTLGHANYQIDAVHMIAIAVPDLNEKIKWNLQALKLIETHPHQKRWLPAICNNLAEAYLSAEKFELALDLFQKIIDLETASGRHPAWYMKKDVARCLRLTGNPAQALAIMQPLADEEEKTCRYNGWISEELAEDLSALARHKDALPHFKRAFAVFAADPWTIAHEPHRLAHLKTMAEA